LVDCARRAIATGGDIEAAARDAAAELDTLLLTDVVNATGVLLHTNLGRAPVPQRAHGRAMNVELDLASGKRGSRHEAVSRLLGPLCGADAAVVVNNNAAAVLLVLAALANGRGVAVSRGESVEIGGGFRIPEVMEQSGARLVDVGTTNRTRAADYERAVARDDIALVMKIHPSNFTVSGFVESTPVRDLAALPVPVVVDVGSGLLDNTCPWLHGRSDGVPQWLTNEPAVRQSINDGADLVTFSGDKLLGGPQCGVIAGRADLVAACATHPLMRALRPGSHVLAMLQETLLSYVARDVCDTVPFWSMATATVDSLEVRARAVAAAAGIGRAEPTEALVGAGSAPGTTIPSWGVVIDGDITAALRHASVPIAARTRDGVTIVDVRTIPPSDDDVVIGALAALR
jgi:L-seryl-tRNA(Ser) seleniumtransferase